MAQSLLLNHHKHIFTIFFNEMNEKKSVLLEVLTEKKDTNLIRINI